MKPIVFEIDASPKSAQLTPIGWSRTICAPVLGEFSAMHVPLTLADFLYRAELVYGDKVAITNEPNPPEQSRRIHNILLARTESGGERASADVAGSTDLFDDIISYTALIHLANALGIVDGRNA